VHVLRIAQSDRMGGARHLLLPTITSLNPLLRNLRQRQNCDDVDAFEAYFVISGAHGGRHTDQSALPGAARGRFSPSESGRISPRRRDGSHDMTRPWEPPSSLRSTSLGQNVPHHAG
jgi:hypothetical protein